MLHESIYSVADNDRAVSLKAAAYMKVKLMKRVAPDALTLAIARIRDCGMKPVLGSGVSCEHGCWLEACVPVRQNDNAGEMNGFLKLRANLPTQPLTFRGDAIQLAPGYTAKLNLPAIETYRMRTYTTT